MTTNEAILAKLAKLSEKLTYTSEIDAPLHAFLWQSRQAELSCEVVAQILNLPTHTEIVHQSFEDVFSIFTINQD